MGRPSASYVGRFFPRGGRLELRLFLSVGYRGLKVFFSSGFSSLE